MLERQEKHKDKTPEIILNRKRAQEFIEKAKNHEYFLPTRYYDHLSFEEMQKEYDGVAEDYEKAANWLLLIPENDRTKDDYALIQNCYLEAARTSRQPSFSNALQEHARIYAMLAKEKFESDKKSKNSITHHSILSRT